MKFAAHLNVMPRAEISDPQGQTVERTLPAIGFEGITGVRVGKRITFTVEAPDENAARTIAASASEKLLANPVIEDFELELNPPLRPTVGVVVFPGSNCDRDADYSFEYLGADTKFLWHLETDLDGIDVIVLPGGFAYGDYLRTGAMAAYSPVMDSVRRFAAAGKPVIGICNGFQVLCEAGLLPGALRRNSGLRFRCMPVRIRVETLESPFTSGGMWPGQVLTIPIAHFDGSYYAGDETLEELLAERRIAFRYCDAEGELTPESNPNGSRLHIAGILNPERNVLGMMPHPERAVDPAVGGTDGRLILNSLLYSLQPAET